MLSVSSLAKSALFPTGRRRKVGRREVMPARRMQKPQEFYRYWSVSSVFAPQLSPGGATGAAGLAKRAHLPSGTA
jgi:hypothetical protein